MVIFYIYFTLFILFAICSCLDGQDLKPRWKRWLVKKLNLYDFFPKSLQPINIQVNKPIKLSSRIEIPLLEETTIGKEMAIDITKKRCMDAIMHEVAKNGLVNFEIIDNPNTLSTTISAELFINKNIN